MPRNGSGTYTLAEPAFVTGTTISSTAVNSDLSDIANAMTGSVAADGQTTITGALKGASGSVSLPSYSFSSDLDSGMYRVAANNIGLAVGGTKIIDIVAQGIAVAGAVSVSGQVQIADGTVSAPGLCFNDDSNLGLYRIGTDNLGIAANGAKVLDIGTTGLGVTGTLIASGAATLQSTLGVTGAATLSSTLAVTGGTTLSSTLGVTGAATFASTVGVTGVLTANNAAGITGRNTCKASLMFTTDSGGAITVSGASFNIASVIAASVGGQNGFAVTFTNALSGTNYSFVGRATVNTSITTNVNVQCRSTDRTAGTANFVIIDTGGGAIRNSVIVDIQIFANA